MTPEPARVAVVGGTFDPVHLGHLALAVGARDRLGAAEAWLLPARTPNLRDPPVAPAQLRLAMLEAAVRGIPRVAVIDLELRRSGVSYTIDSTEALAETHPEVEPWWVFGADAIRQIGRWHRSADLLGAARIAVVQRAGTPAFDDAEARALGLHPARTMVLDMVPPDVSASEIRRMIAASEPITTLVPEPVAAIIAASGLYRSGRPVR